MSLGGMTGWEFGSVETCTQTSAVIYVPFTESFQLHFQTAFPVATCIWKIKGVRVLWNLLYTMAGHKELSKQYNPLTLELCFICTSYYYSINEVITWMDQKFVQFRRRKINTVSLDSITKHIIENLFFIK